MATFTGRRTAAAALAIAAQSSRITSAGAETLAYAFTGATTDGAIPKSALLKGPDGNFYGTTSSGGAGYGTVFKMTPEGVVTVRYAFTGGPADGAYPAAALILAADGNFYGTTLSGGSAGLGTVFRMSPAGTVTVVHAFAGGATDGANPAAALIQAADGDFYGTTMGGGASGLGTVFRMTPGGAVTVLHGFTGGIGDGASPMAPLVQATDGNFYGTTAGGSHVCATKPSPAPYRLRNDLQGDRGRRLCCVAPFRLHERGVPSCSGPRRRDGGDVIRDNQDPGAYSVPHWAGFSGSHLEERSRFCTRSAEGAQRLRGPRLTP